MRRANRRMDSGDPAMWQLVATAASMFPIPAINASGFYQLDGNEAVHQLDIGNGGSGPGELDEPSGLALHTDGRVFVADTWNRRIAVFDSEGDHLQNFRVRGWYDSTFNRPYLALDEWRNMLYITDPDSKSCLGLFVHWRMHRIFRARWSGWREWAIPGDWWHRY